jgi:putative ABC transport system substrate-binding protein
VARAQRPATPTVGILHLLAADASYTGVPALLRGIREMGFVEASNARIEYRWAENHSDRLPKLVDELVRLRVDVIAALGGDAPALAARAATTTIPIVFVPPGSPVEKGLVASFNRPGGNVTGVAGLSDELVPKRMALLRELVPTATVVGIMATSINDYIIKILQSVAPALGLGIHVVYADTEDEVEAGFARLVQLGAGVLIVVPSASYVGWRERFVALAARHRLPASYHRREFVEIGGLFSYGADLDDAFRLAGVYVGRILKGEHPRDLPVVQPTKIEMAVNLATAKTLGITVPETLLATADEVIQ